MSKELVISSNRHETRVALLEDDQLVEVYFQRANEYSLAGSIHKGRVTRVLPGMQSAFVDLGLERDTFLYVSDFLEEEHEDIDRVTGDERPPRENSREGGREHSRDRDRDRERRPAMRPPQEPPVAASAPVSAPEASAPAVSDAPAAPVEAGTIPTQERPADKGGEDRDRRGRRSRRRRNRGRGFPESKYAEVGPAATPVIAAPPDAEPVVDVTPSHVETRTEAPIVLPGESLAKYRGGPQTAPVEHVTARPTSVPPPLPTEEDLDVQTEQGVYLEPIHYPPENALPDAPAHSAPDGSLASVGQESDRHLQTPPPLPAEAVSAQEAEDLEDAAQSGPITAPMLDEDEDLDIQAMILGEAGVEEATEDEETAEADLEGEPDAPAAEVTGEAAPPSLPMAPRKSANRADAFRIAFRAAIAAAADAVEIGRTIEARVNKARQNKPRVVPGPKVSSANPDPKATGPADASAFYPRKCSRSPSPTF